MKRNIKLLMMAAAAIFFVASCSDYIPADEHPNIKPVPEEPEVIDVEIDYEEFGGIEISVVDYQHRGLGLADVAVVAKGGESVKGSFCSAPAHTLAPMKAGASDSEAVAGWKTPVQIDSAMAKAPKIIFYVPEGTYSQGFDFKLTDTEGRIMTIEHHASTVVTAGEEASVVVPLAPVTIYYGKSNCYRSDAVAGNVVIDITPYYSLAGDLTYANKAALNKDGQPVAPAASAAIVWQLTGTGIDGNVIAADPTISGNELTVPVTGKLGNAVVAIKDAAGTVLWSYHVWVSPASDVQYNLELDVDKGWGAGFGQYKMLDRNLGATSTAFKDQDSYGCFYQWGRKDPFKRLHNLERPAGSPYSTPYEDAIYYADTGETTGTVYYAIKNPDTKIQSANDWHFGVRNNYLWGNPNVPAVSSDLYTMPQKGVRTVYDPCPEGYRVPAYRYMSMAFTSVDECNDQYGHNFLTGDGETRSYWPTGGQIEKNPEKRFIMYLEYRGYYWSNVPGGTGAYSRLVNNNAGSKGSGMDRACACSVRCVKDE